MGYSTIKLSLWDAHRELLVLRNDSDAPIDLLGYSLSDAVTWTQLFPLVGEHRYPCPNLNPLPIDERNQLN